MLSLNEFLNFESLNESLNSLVNFIYNKWDRVENYNKQLLHKKGTERVSVRLRLSAARTCKQIKAKN